MPRSRTKHALLVGFGGALRVLHERYERAAGRTMSHEAIARIVSKRLAATISTRVKIGGTTLWRWEAGEVASPDPLVLEELEAVYDVAPGALLHVLRSNLREPAMTKGQGVERLDHWNESARATADIGLAGPGLPPASIARDTEAQPTTLLPDHMAEVLQAETHPALRHGLKPGGTAHAVGLAFDSSRPIYLDDVQSITDIGTVLVSHGSQLQMLGEAILRGQISDARGVERDRTPHSRTTRRASLPRRSRKAAS